MLEQTGNAVTFYAFFVEEKLGKTGLTVTVDVYRNSSEIVTAGSASEVGDGLYKYQLASGSVNAEGEYLAVFKTATDTVDQQHIPAIWVVNKAGVENLDGAISAVPTVEEIDDELSDNHGSGAWGAGGNGGALSLTYTLTSSQGGAAIQGAIVELYAESGMITLIDSKVTNALGQVTFENLVAGTYYLKRIKSGFTFGNPDTEVVS